jgi:hypothetical protein
MSQTKPLPEFPVVIVEAIEAKGVTETVKKMFIASSSPTYRMKIKEHEDRSLVKRYRFQQNKTKKGIYSEAFDQYIKPYLQSDTTSDEHNYGLTKAETRKTNKRIVAVAFIEGRNAAMGEGLPIRKCGEMIAVAFFVSYDAAQYAEAALEMACDTYTASSAVNGSVNASKPRRAQSQSMSPTDVGTQVESRPQSNRSSPQPPGQRGGLAKRKKGPAKKTTRKLTARAKV